MRATTRTVVLACLMLAVSTAATAATFTVTKTADTNDGACNADCSLREAVVAANALAGVDTIVLPAGTYVLTIPDTDENAAANGDLDIIDELTISGAGSATTIVDGNNATRVFHVLASTPVSISNVTIRNGATTGFGGGLDHTGIGTVTLAGVVVTGNQIGGFGGGINNNSTGSITINGSTISNNSAGGFGGGINNNVAGSITINGSTISNNSAGGFGGGINNNSGGTLVVQSSAVSGNTATGFGGGGINNNSTGSATLTLVSVTGNTAQNGGGINNNSLGSLTVDRATVANNVATGSIGGGGILNNSTGSTVIVESVISGNTTAGFGGGGIDNNFTGNVSIENSTVSGNTASGSNGGGGIYNNNSSGSIQLLHVTVANNAATNGGRSLHDNGSGGNNIVVRNSIIANPASGANCGGATNTSQGNNLVSDASCGFAAVGDLQSTNPLLAPLANNGGPTFTHALCTGSPALDAAAPGLVAVDQRLVARPIGGASDIGAFEGAIACGAPPVPTLSIASVAANEGNAGITTFTFTVTLSAASATPVTVNFATADGTATAGSDYTATSGTLTFAPGVLTQPIAVSVLGDTTVEATETFVVNLSAPTNATIATAQGVGTIINDDAGVPPPPPTAPIPTLSEWSLLLLSLMLGGIAWTQVRSRRRR